MVRVSVTQEHIDEGERESATFCPLAQAIHDALPESIHSVEVLEDRITGCRDGGQGKCERFHVRMGASLREFVRAFDAGETVVPFEFNLNVDLPG